MAEVAVTKQTKPEGEFTRWLGFDTPFFRGNMFGVNPFTLMRQFTGDMDRVFGKAPNGAEWYPAIEVKKKDGKFLVTAELPGVKKEDVKINVVGETLTVEGERKEEKEEKREGYFHSERSYGKFFRSIPLPEGVKTGEVTAHFKEGMLEISAPFFEVKEKTQAVPIH